jgi:TM2 domain-containing membrane protein YozV
MQQDTDSPAGHRQHQSGAKKASMTTAYLLLISLGYLGAHRLYLGRRTSASIMLTLFMASCVGIFFLIGFVGLTIIILWMIIDIFLIPGMCRTLHYRNRSINQIQYIDRSGVEKIIYGKIEFTALINNKIINTETLIRIPPENRWRKAESLNIYQSQSDVMANNNMAKNQLPSKKPIWITACYTIFVALISVLIGKFISNIFSDILYRGPAVDETAAFVSALIGTVVSVVPPLLVWHHMRGGLK